MSNTLELKVVFAAIDKFSASAKSVNKISGQLSKELKAAKDAFKDLEKQQGLIDSFRSTNKAIGITNNDLKVARERVEQMAKAMKDVALPSSKMQRDFKTATEEARHLAAQANRLAEKKQRLRGELAAVGIDTKKLSDHQRDLRTKMASATDAVTAQAGALEKHNKLQQTIFAGRADIARSRQTASKLAGFGTKAMAGGAAVNAAAAIPVLAYAKAEDSATQLKVAMMIKDGTVSSEFRAVSDLAMQLGTKLPGTASDYQDMMTMLIRQGMPAKNILGGLGEATAYLAVQLKMAPTAAAEFASKLQDATRASDKEMMALMDTIQRTFYLGVDQNNMLAGFSKLSPALSIIKKEGAEAAKALAPLLVMADQSGMQGEAAGNAFRKIFQMSLDQKKVAKGNSELGGTGIKLDFTNGKGEFGGLDKMYAQLEKLRGVNSVKRLAALKKIFGDDAETLQALTLMVEKGAAGYADVQAKMEKQADLQRRVNEQLGTLKSLWETATGTFETAMVRFGEAIAPELKATAEWMVKVTDGIDKWAKENPGLSKSLMTTVKWLGLAALSIGAIATAAGAIVVPLAVMKFSMVSLGWTGAGSMGMLSLAIKGVGLALKATAIGALVTTLITGAVLVIENWDKVKEFFASMLDGFFVKFNQLKENLRYLMPGTFGDLKDTPTRATTTGVISASPLLKQAAAGAGYNITINAAQGSDNQELARLVGREIERLDREKAARTRGRLRDTE